MENQRRREVYDNNNVCSPTATAHAIFDDEDLVRDILSRLPAKSVLQVKCVCKHWRSLIRDPHFTDLHFRRSKTRPRLFFANPLPSQESTDIGITYQLAWEKRQHKVCFWTIDLPTGDARRIPTRRKENHSAAIHTITKQTQFSYAEICGAVNGLICFVHHSNRAACIYNISTREATPWIQSKLVDELVSEENWERHQVVVHHSSFEFGFDPATKAYKVISVSRFIISPKAQEDAGTYKDCEAWEVLKLGDNAWRSIEEESPLRLGSYPLSIYANGNIYWFPDHEFGQCLLGFDVGTENFRMIQIPKLIHDRNWNPHQDFTYWIHLLPLDDRVAVLRFTSADTIKVFIFDDSLKDTSEAGDLDTDNKNWTEDSITLPFSWNDSLDPYFEVVEGTDRIILEIHQEKSKGKSTRISHYSCDWKKKNKTFKELEISGFPSSIPVDCFDDRLGIPFTENLLPLKSL